MQKMIVDNDAFDRVMTENQTINLVQEAIALPFAAAIGRRTIGEDLL